MRNKVFWIILIFLLAGLAVYLFKSETPIKVRLTTVSKGQVDLTVSNTRAGTIKACNRSRLSLPIGGQIAALFITEGDHVKKDQVLIRLWNKDQQARYAEAKANVVVTQLAAIESCRLAALNSREQKRLAGLAAKKLVSVERLDTATTQMAISAASCKKAKATINSAKAALQLQAAMLEKTELTAPFAGVIAEINGEVGEYITPSPSGVATPPAVDLIADGCLYVSAPVDEVEAAKIQQGMAVNVTLDAFRGETMAGEVTRIAPYVKELEKQARTVDIDVKLLDKSQQQRLLIGYSADIDVIIEQQTNTLRLPTETVIDGNSVLLYEVSSGTLLLKEFTPGISNWRYTEVKEGLSDGDRVLLTLDVDGAVDGASVTVEE
ncbi:MAG: efflux transporter periplasmic adaptor subunit [Piscirickettsiaceae bacterium]|nr:MAG: efflux transporter periplasmic adaptor subunit [Piscirickettsiaceae bacterium]